MKVVMEFDIEIDGRDMTDDEIQTAFGHVIASRSVIPSEEVDGTDEWAIVINCWAVDVVREEQK